MHLYPSLEKPPPGLDLNYKVEGINEHRVKFKKKNSDSKPSSDTILL